MIPGSGLSRCAVQFRLLCMLSLSQIHVQIPRCAQFHALVLSAFASLIAPFGGFFASGFKRGFKIKDFGDSIPGHGGMTDRMDCQVGSVRSPCTADIRHA